MLHDKPAEMNSNWFGWKALKKAVDFMLVVDYAAGAIKDDTAVLCYG